MNNISRYISSEKLKSLLLGLFIASNFINRDISNILLLFILLICLFDYKQLEEILLKYKSLLFSIVIFTLWISIIGFYHNAPLREFDNYYRFLLLVPLLSIVLNRQALTLIIVLSSIMALTHFINSLPMENLNRYSGTSNNAITYANILSILLVISVYLLPENKSKLLKQAVLFVSIIILSIILIYTETRGPLIGIVISFVYLIYYFRNKLILVSTLLMFLAFITIPNSLYDRVLLLTDIDITKPLETKHTSSRERLYYLSFGIEKIQGAPILGIGPQNVEDLMRTNMVKLDIANITARDHLHNEFIDIAAKFGLVSLLLLLAVYINIYMACSNDRKSLSIILLIMLISSQLTQSQFAHHQAISFFIILLYVCMQSPYKDVIKKDKS
ncbi:O-antigen ligase family protein [Gammaproteobacteria bacterium]|nr:O-antigen ligase family protein [Gammaproteobacteria bacterium]